MRSTCASPTNHTLLYIHTKGNLYDNVKKAQTPAAQKKAQAALDKAMAQAKAQVAKATK